MFSQVSYYTVTPWVLAMESKFFRCVCNTGGTETAIQSQSGLLPTSTLTTVTTPDTSTINTG